MPWPTSKKSTVPQTVKHLITLTFIALAVTATALHFLSNDTPDDAFITFRYAERLAAGDGFTFNDGERVLGTTTPLYGLSLAPFAAAFGPGALPTAARIYGLTLFLATLALVWQITVTLSRRGWLASCVVLLCGTSFWTSHIITYGMEIPLFLFVLALGVYLFIRERPFAAALAFGLLPMIRPEGVFVVGYVGLYLLTARYLYPALALVLPGTLYAALATAYYGTPIPQSITAKTGNLYDIALTYTYGLVRDEFARYLAWPLGTNPSLSPAVAMGLALIVAAIALFGGYRLARHHRILGVLPVLPVACSTLYIASRTSIFPWYWGTFELPLLICWTAGLSALVSRVVRQRAAVAVAITLLVAFGNNLQQPAWRTLERSAYPYTSSRHRDYYTIASQLSNDLPPGATVAMPEIGVLGYFLPRQTVLDAAGLVTPGAAPYFDGGGTITLGFVRAYQPDLIISPESLIAEDLLNSATLTDDFVLLDVYVHIHIYRAKDFQS